MAWSPLTDVGNVVLWIDASQQTGIGNGGAVASATDFSGLARHATQATPSKQPIFLTGIQNGLPVMRFDGADDALATPSFAWGAAQASCFVVCNPAATSLAVFLELSPDFNVANAWLMHVDTNKLVAAHHGTPNTSAWKSGSDVTGAWHVTEYVGDPSLATNEAVAWIDGNLTGAVLINTNTTIASMDPNPVYIGARAAASLFAQIDIAEILCFNKALSQSERESVEGYLAWKWGLAANLPALHPYISAPPGGFPVVATSGADGPDELAATRREQIRQRDFLARQRDDEEVLEAVAKVFSTLCR